MSIMTKIGMICDGDVRSSPCSHPTHEGFGRAVDAEFLPLSGVSLPGPMRNSVAADILRARQVREFDISYYDVVLFEYGHFYHALPFIHTHFPDVTTILIATHQIYGHRRFDFGEGVQNRLRRLDRRVSTTLIHNRLAEADGVIAVSDLVADYVRQVTPGTPVEVATPYIQPAVDRQLMTVTPNLKSHSAAVICDARPHKGVDILVRAWPAIRKEFPDATLQVVGNGHPQRYAQVSGVTVHGYVEDLTDVLPDVSLYVHPARVDAWAVAVIEAMRAAIPPIVTETTGARSAVRRLDLQLVTEPRPSDLKRAISQYFERPTSSKEFLSRRAREIAGEYLEPDRTALFVDALTTLLDRVDEQ